MAPKRSTNVRDAIVDQATRLFGDRGFEGVALRHIAEQCGIPLSTLSHHFPAKQNLQDLVMERALDEVLERVLVSLRKSGGARDRLLNYIADIVDLLLSDMPEVKVFDRELQSLDDVIIKNIAARPAVGSTLTALIEEISPEILADVPAPRMGDLLFAMIYGAIRLRRMHGSSAAVTAADRLALTSELSDLFLRIIGEAPSQSTEPADYYAALGQFIHEHLAVQEMLQAAIMQRCGLSRAAAQAIFADFRQDTAPIIVRELLGIQMDDAAADLNQAVAQWWIIDSVHRTLHLKNGNSPDAEIFERSAMTVLCRQPAISPSTFRKMSYDLQAIKTCLLAEVLPSGDLQARAHDALPGWQYQPPVKRRVEQKVTDIFRRGDKRS